jgi:hypothetical protein
MREDSAVRVVIPNGGDRMYGNLHKIFTHFSAQWCYEDVLTPRDFAPSAGRLNDALPIPRNPAADPTG